VAGLKPTFGRVSTDGVVPLAASMDHVGAMARCVRDLGILYQAIADPQSSEETPLPRLPPRLGRLRGLFQSGADAAILRTMDDVCERLSAGGATIVETALPDRFVEVTARHRTVMAVEAAAFHETRLRSVPHDYDLNIRALLEEGLACPAPEYVRCKEAQRRLRGEMLPCFTDIDALLTPATTGPAPDAATTGDPLFNSPWSFTGLPTVCFPAGRSREGLPLGIQLVGGPWSENGLLTVAAWCEDAAGLEAAEPAL
jgi:aspartyl-tRNA(Asn)/glutamyl-tRNA(Gln) amidotransferase subunit A